MAYFGQLRQRIPLISNLIAVLIELLQVKIFKKIFNFVKIWTLLSDQSLNDFFSIFNAAPVEESQNKFLPLLFGI
jgi:hypothetical protein